MPTRIFRVVVRGHFHGLDDEQRALLRADAGEHEIFKARYTRAGTFTYEPNLVAFSFRYELRSVEDSEADAERLVLEAAMDAARTALRTMAIEHRHLRATATDMASVWS